NQAASDSQPLTLRFAHNVIEHLGLKLYQNKPTNVLAELVSNSWDAMATNVFIDLEVSAQGTPEAIGVYDDGRGMSKDDLVNNYLVVGQPKPRPVSIDGGTSTRFPMGRKGIGKLAPFGIARIVHVITVQNSTAIWLRFDYEAMLAAESQNASATAIYAPSILADEIRLDDLSTDQEAGMQGILEKFKNSIAQSGAGTLI
ncbi:MAG: ATP-binding protein, partial [Bryobacterales bacterium]|nr:ATP-binding protein [Bryobacterales bacterium]